MRDISFAPVSQGGSWRPSEIGWAALDEPDKAGAGQEYVAAVISLNDLSAYSSVEGVNDTYNVLLLRKCNAGDFYQRAGWGEVIIKDRFAGSTESSLCVV